ncbi:MAG TPA: type II toxin-antitoxin system prevent-host-death family antitoxin [bacterium]|nr:type II toxin-antitoxin system prevent-host-death family antitoxin [bacterium]
MSRYLRDAEKEEIVITPHGKPAGVLIGFSSEDDWSVSRPSVAAWASSRVSRSQRVCKPCRLRIA